MSGIQSRQEKILIVIAHAIMILLAILAIAPFWLMITGSLTDNDVLARTGYQFIPAKFSLDAYRYIVREWAQIGNAYMVTIFVTVVGTVSSLLIVSLAGYTLSQRDLPGMKVISVFILITILFNGGVVASYVIYSNVFHIKDTIWALIVPNLLLNGFNVILVKNYMSYSIPHELQEAAAIDGAGPFGIFFRIILPLSKPTQEVLAGKLSIDRSLLSHIEAGKRECSVSLLVQLSEIFSVSLEMLAFGKGKAVLDTIQLESDLDGAIALLMRMKDGLH